MKRIVLGWFAFVLAAALSLGQPLTASAETGGRFILLDTKRKVVTDFDYRGKFLLMFFGYTFCPDICPTGMQDVAEVLELLGKDAEEVNAVFVSIDPDRDTSRMVDEYVKNFDDRIIGLTGTKASIASISKKYRIVVRKVEEKPGDPDYTIDHTASILLIDPAGRYVRRFGFETPPANIVKTVRDLMVR